MGPIRFGLIVLALVVALGAGAMVGAQSGDAPPEEEPAADAPRLQIESNIPPTFQAGTEHELHVRIQLHDPTGSVETAVLFLNVVEIDEEGTFPQAMHKVFASADVNESVFRTPLTGERLREGVEASVRVRLRAQAPPGEYAIVIQLFGGDQTDPHDVRVEDRVAMKSFEFTVLR